MNDSQLKTLMEAVSECCGQAILEKRYRESILVGALGYILFNESGHQTFAQATLGFVSDAIALSAGQPAASQIHRKSSEPSCSFCGRRDPQVKLAAGPDAFICDSCVATLSKTFATGKSGEDQP